MRLLAVVLAVFTSATLAIAQRPPAARADTFPRAHDYRFVVDRAWSRSAGVVAAPGTDPPDREFHAVAPAVRYTVRFAAGAQAVTITDTAGRRVAGTRGADDGDAWVFALDSFAGGEFRVRQRAGRIEAAITRFGSGVPVVSSERGVLEDGR